MATYRNLGFDEACDLLGVRERRLESQIIERNRDLEFEPTSPADKDRHVGFGARILGQPVEVDPTARSRILREFGMNDCAGVLPQGLLVQALNHLVWSRLCEAGSLKVWHDSSGRLLHLDWSYRQRPRLSGTHAFRTAFAAIPMRNDHTVRRPTVLSLADLPTRVEVAADCQKTRDTAPDDPSHGGVMLRHSEMGAVRTTLSATIYRAICWNYLVFGPSESDLIYVGTARIPLGLNDLAGSLAGRLGGLLNRIRRLAYVPCLPMSQALPIMQLRWDLAQETSEALLEGDTAPANDYEGRSEGGYLYHVLNCFTWVTTHRRAKMPQRDCTVLSGLADSLLMEESPLQRILQADVKAATPTRRFRLPPMFRQTEWVRIQGRHTAPQHP